MLVNYTLNFAECMRCEASISCQCHWIQPEFAFAVGGADMDVSWFAPLIRIKVEPKWSDAKNRWHKSVPHATETFDMP